MSEKTKYSKISTDDSRAIPYIDETPKPQHQLPNGSETTSCMNSSCESLPTQAPLVRQPRCSIDIDTQTIKDLKQTRSKGLCPHQNAYLDNNAALRDSVRELP